MESPRESLGNPYVILVIVFGAPLVCVLLAIPAYLGVWWGQRREEAATRRG